MPVSPKGPKKAGVRTDIDHQAKGHARTNEHAEWNRALTRGEPVLRIWVSTR
jgi:hypothetical protein